MYQYYADVSIKFEIFLPKQQTEPNAKLHKNI